MSKTIRPEELVDIQKWRYAVKIFDASKKIPADSWKAIEEALVLTPSSYGLQPWKFLVIEDPAMRQKLTPFSWGQKQVADSSHYVVFVGRTDITEADVDRFIVSTAQTQNREISSLDNYRGLIVKDLVTGPRHKSIHEWVSRQVYIALGNFMTSCAMLGVDTCPMEGIDPVQYDAALGLTGSGYSTRVACAAGYRSPSDKYAATPKVRYPKTELIQNV